MSNFYEAVIKKDRRFGSTAVITDLALLEPGFRAGVLRLLSAGKAAGHDLRVLETLRSPARQKMLFDRHATELEHVGCHGYGLGCDLGLFVHGKYDPKGLDYEFFLPLAKQARVISGIDWGHGHPAAGFKDWDHVQGCPVFRQEALFAGEWYPGPGYDPIADEAAHGGR